MLIKTFFVFASVVYVLGHHDGDLSRIVHTDQGPVRGYKDDTGDIFVFYNIPYATTPTGVDRYKAPLPPPTWSEPFEAVNRDIVCPQHDAGISGLNVKMQEDCLIANIHVPVTDEKNLPVLVYVHGGAFQIGYGNKLSPKKLIQTKNLIVVTFNYRLGIHGFLCLGTEDAPGNAGIKDQVALLRWVNRNIASFGGNPNDVTIAGCSAGSSSVDLLMLSDITKGLFNKVIAGSGASLSGFSVQIDPLGSAQEQGLVLNFTNVEDIAALGESYKNIPIEKLLLTNFRNRKHSGVEFAPCVERDIGQEMFLKEAPIDILKKGDYPKMPIIYGFTSMEGLIRRPFFEEWKDEMNEKFSNFLSIDLQFDNEQEREEVAAKIKQFYFGDAEVSGDTILNFINYFTDVMFSYSMLWSVQLHTRNGNDQVYLYEYSYVDDDVPIIPYTNVRGAEHCAQNNALLDGRSSTLSDETNISDGFRAIKKIMREMWSNFITTGQPVPANSSLPSWPPANEYRTPHMSFGFNVELKGILLEQRFRFWDEIYDKHYRTPKSPAIPN